MNLTLSEVFCEIISGIALIFLILCMTDTFGGISLAEAAACIDTALDAAGLLGASYLLGVVANAAGLLFDEHAPKCLGMPDAPSNEEIKLFWGKVTSHVLKYRDNVWTYYYCYRNLVLILPLATPFFIIARWDSWGGRGLLAVPVAVFLWLSLFAAAKALLGQYYELTRAVAAGPPPAATGGPRPALPPQPDSSSHTQTEG